MNMVHTASIHTLEDLDLSFIPLERFKHRGAELSVLGAVAHTSRKDERRNHRGTPMTLRRLCLYGRKFGRSVVLEKNCG